jgi:hypothetical protein
MAVRAAGRGSVAIAAVLMTVLALAGCKDSGSGSAAGSTPAGSTPAGSATTAPASGSSTTSSSSASSSSSVGRLPSNGKCVLIGRAKASQLLGAPAQGSAANVGKATHVDGCSYVSKAGNLGYDVNQFPGQPTTFIAAAKKAAKGPIKVYSVRGGDDSFAFTLAVGGKTMARAEVASGPLLIAVNSVAADAAQAKRMTQAAIDLLVLAVTRSG